MRITPHPMKIIESEHIVADVKRAIALDDVIPMMIIGENGDVCVIGTTIVPLILQNRVVQVDHDDPLDPIDIGHHMIMMDKGHIVHLAIDTMRE
jgi:hypothetical protein